MSVDISITASRGLKVDVSFHFVTRGLKLPFVSKFAVQFTLQQADSLSRTRILRKNIDLAWRFMRWLNLLLQNQVYIPVVINSIFTPPGMMTP